MTSNFITLKNMGFFESYQNDQSTQPKKVKTESKNNDISIDNIRTFNLSISDDSENDIDSKFCFHNKMIFNSIKYQYDIVKKEYSMNHIFFLFKTLNIDEKLLIKFCRTFLSDKEKEYHDTFFNEKYKSNFYYICDRDLFHHLDFIFEKIDIISYFEVIYNDFCEKSLSKDNIFSYILKYLFSFRDNIYDDNELELQYLDDHDPVFWLSINILYNIHYDYDYKFEKDILISQELSTELIEEESYNISNNKENDGLLGKKRKSEKNTPTDRRRKILKTIKVI